MVIIIGFKQKTSIQETASIACKVTVTICSVEAQNKENNNILSCVMNWFIKTIGTRVQFSFWERIAVNMSCSYAGKCHGYTCTAVFMNIEHSSDDAQKTSLALFCANTSLFTQLNTVSWQIDHLIFWRGKFWMAVCFEIPSSMRRLKMSCQRNNLIWNVLSNHE